MSFKDDQLIFRYFEYKKNYNKDLINRFANTYRFCNEDINKFILLLRKDVYPYDQMDSQEGSDETPLPNKKVFTANCI